MTNPIFSKEAVEQYIEKRTNNKKGRLSTFLKEKHEQHKLDKRGKFMEVTVKKRIKGYLHYKTILCHKAVLDV